MTTVQTDLRTTRESARRQRFEPTGSISETNVQKAIEQVATQPPAVTKTSVVAAQSPYAVLPTDTFLALDTSGGAITINLGNAASRNGVPLTIKDVTGNAAANNISVVGEGAETLDSLATYPINADFGGARLVPLVGSGYTVDA